MAFIPIKDTQDQNMYGMKKVNLNILKQPFVILMVGPPLVGKSTALKEWIATFKGDVTVISRDAILLNMHGNNNYSEAFNTVNQKAVNTELQKSIEDAAYNGDNTIIDMTNLSTKKRKQTLANFDSDYTKIAVIFPVPKLEELLERNKIRFETENKHIPKHVIISMMNSFNPIKDDEGINKIISL